MGKTGLRDNPLIFTGIRGFFYWNFKEVYRAFSYGS